MEWITPKTDWESSDRFNITDYNRIKNNISHLQEFSRQRIKEVRETDMGADITDYAAYWSVDYFNAFEENVMELELAFHRVASPRQTFFENGQFIKFDELNRIEGTLEKMKSTAESIMAGLRRLAFRLGSDAFLAI